MTKKSFSITDLTLHDLQQSPPFRLNVLLKQISEELSKTQGSQGEFAFDSGPFTFRGTVRVKGTLGASGLLQFKDNQGAIAGGLQKGDFWRDPTGLLHVVI